MSPGRLRALGWIALAVAAIAVPFFFGSFRVGQFTQVLCYAVAILGLNVLVGFSGQISLGHGAFFGLGAYAGAVLITDANFPTCSRCPSPGSWAWSRATCSACRRCACAASTWRC
jgi:ABC-type branched-subunit amino acid transport system permease subunit